jgi:hypothetical protein
MLLAPRSTPSCPADSLGSPLQTERELWPELQYPAIANESIAGLPPAAPPANMLASARASLTHQLSGSLQVRRQPPGAAADAALPSLPC